MTYINVASNNKPISARAIIIGDQLASHRRLCSKPLEETVLLCFNWKKVSPLLKALS